MEHPMDSTGGTVGEADGDIERDGCASSVTVRVDGSAIELLEYRLTSLLDSVMESSDDSHDRAREMKSCGLFDSIDVLRTLGFTVDVDGSGRFRIGVPSRRRDVLSVSEAAVELGVSPGRVRQLLSPGDGRLIGRKVGSSWVVDADSVGAYRDGRRPYGSAGTE